MKKIFCVALLAASIAQASLQIETDYDLPGGAHKSAKLYLVDKDVEAGNWIPLPSATSGDKRYSVQLQAKERDDGTVDLKFRLSEKVGKRSKLLASPSAHTRLGESVEVRQRNKKTGSVFRVQARPSSMDG